jgi:hypothetical protein
MTYQYRVTLTGIKGFYRVYLIDGASTLYSFHKQMRADMEFPQDQLILFKGLDSSGNVVARFGLFDLGAGAADQISISQTVGNGITSFVYFYDVTNKKSVNITLEGESQDPAPSPVLIDSKGPDPIEFENGYVAFEDLPAEQRHLPPDDDEDKPRKGGLASLLNMSLDDLDDLKDDEDPDDEDLDDEDAEDDEDPDDEDGKLIYDGTEELRV